MRQAEGRVNQPCSLRLWGSGGLASTKHESAVVFLKLIFSTIQIRWRNVIVAFVSNLSGSDARKVALG